MRVLNNKAYYKLYNILFFICAYFYDEDFNFITLPIIFLSHSC